MERTPFISAKCLTFGRTHLLEEAIYSFLQQDYPDDKKEMIIVNDYPLQTLVFDHPLVKIFNLKETFKTIGEKDNFAIEQCQGELISVFDDDDIALSNHFQNIKKYWREDTNLLHWQNAVFYNIPHITKLMAVGNSGIVYSKNAWEAIGKSPIENAGGDMTMVIKMHELGRDKVILANPKNEECSWYYRWGLPMCFHQSGAGTDTPDRPNIIERHSAYIEQQRKLGNIPTGIIELHPHWNQPYDILLKSYCNALK